LLFNVKGSEGISEREESIVNPGLYFFDPRLELEGEGKADSGNVSLE